MSLNVDKKSSVFKTIKKFFANFANKFFSKFFWRQHPDAALRYFPVVSAIKKNKLENTKILEIGSGSLGITPYLKKEIDGVDIDFRGPQSKLVNKIKGKADDLPFRKNSYKVVISVDVLEHIKRENREKAIFEMLKVAEKLAVIVVPVGELSEKQDEDLNKLWSRVFSTKDQYLEEHVENGLPKVNEILVAVDRSLRKLDKKAKVTSFPNVNLTVRKLLMRTWITKNKLMYYLYLKGYLLLLPLLKNANFGDCYRRVFVIEFENPVRTHLETSMNNSEKSKGKFNRGGK